MGFLKRLVGIFKSHTDLEGAFNNGYALGVNHFAALARERFTPPSGVEDIRVELLEKLEKSK